jgi:hypothetical protein
LEIDDTNGDINYSPQFTIATSAESFANASVSVNPASTCIAPNSANLTVSASIVYHNNTAIQTGGFTPTRTGKLN